MSHYRLNLINTPSGRYIFVGNVPLELAFVSSDGTKVTEELVSNQLLLPAAYRKIKDRVFESRDEALRAAESMGLTCELK